jgi:metaxin
MTEPQPQPNKWFTVPSPIRKLFRLFPLKIYPSNALPERCSPPSTEVPTLYVFVDERDALSGRPSFNPTCLRAQIALKIAGVKFRLAASNNHASPTGSLPFLLPSPGEDPVPASKIERYAREKGTAGMQDVESLRVQAYWALLDHRIRNFWVCPPRAAAWPSLQSP